MANGVVCDGSGSGGLALAAAGAEFITTAEGGAGGCAGAVVSVAGVITCGGAVVGADVGIAWGVKT